MTEPLESRVMRALVDQAIVSAWVVDEDETVLYANHAAEALTGYRVADLVGRPISVLMPDELRQRHAGFIRAYLASDRHSRVLGRVNEFEIRHRDGSLVPVELKAFELDEKRAGKALFGALISDNRQHKATEAEMRLLARTDHLTGCPNRLGFMERARQEIDRARRHGHDLSLVVMDLDRFKQVNDRHGHQVGDRVLAGLVPRLTAELRNHDVFGRVGGEEFFILFPETGKPECGRIAERLRERLAAEPFAGDDEPITVTACFGCSQLRPDDDLDDLIRRADRRMYIGKTTGRNRVIADAAVGSVQATG